jgi:perosamine synthetase
MIPISRPNIGKEEINAVKRVLEDGNITMGEVTSDFEKSFSRYIGAEHAVATSSGTTALQVGIEALDISKGSEVITTPFSFIASTNTLLFNYLKPVFADIDADSFNIDPEEIEERITSRTRAVLVVHLFGNPCRMKEISELCEDHNLLLIEDCAQAVGAEYFGKKVGSFGDISCFSFYATKNMTSGEGGMILMNDEDMAERAKLLRNHGQNGQYNHVMLGYNYRMNDMQAAIAREQLKKLGRMNEKRIENAHRLTEFLSNIGDNIIETPNITPNTKHVFHQYTIKVFNNRRDDVLKALNVNGVGARAYYQRPIYTQPLYQRIGLGCKCPVTEDISNQALSLPIHPGLGATEIKLIAKEVESAVNM